MELRAGRVEARQGGTRSRFVSMDRAQVQAILVSMKANSINQPGAITMPVGIADGASWSEVGGGTMKRNKGLRRVDGQRRRRRGTGCWVERKEVVRSRRRIEATAEKQTAAVEKRARKRAALQEEWWTDGCKIKKMASMLRGLGAWGLRP